MDARPLDVFHDAGDQDIRSVTDSINFNFASHHVLVNKDGMILRIAVDVADIGINILVGNCNPHPGTAQHIGRADKNRIAQTVCHNLGFVCRKDSLPLRSCDAAPLQHLVKTFPVLCGIDIVRIRSENPDAHLHERARQLDRRLAAELDDRTVRFLQPDNVLNILRCQRFKIELVSNIEVRRYRFRVVVDDDRLEAGFLEGPGTVDRAEIKLDSLSDPDRPGTQHQNLLLIMFSGYLRSLILASVIHRVIVRSLRLELGRTGVHHPE